MSLLVSTDLNKCNIIAFVDSNESKYGMELAGKTILKPNDIKEYQNATIVISVMKYSKEILKTILELGLKNEVISLI